jgi:hypothetical protein
MHAAVSGVAAVLLVVLMQRTCRRLLWRGGPLSPTVAVAVAVSTHHLRDATRRGLWCWPLGSTPPLPYPLFLALTALLPLWLRSTHLQLRKVDTLEL